MSLISLSNSLSLGYAPQLNSRVPKSLGVADPPQVELLGNTDEDSVELTTAKNISDENDFSANNQALSNADYKTRIRIDPETQEVIIEVVDGKTGEEVRQIPGEQQLRLHKGISEYNDILFKRVDNVDSNAVDDIDYQQPEPEK